MGFQNNTNDDLVGSNKELLYVNHILSTLKDAQSSFGESHDGRMNIDRFLLYCAYLENAVLDDKTRAKIMEERKKENKRLSEQKLDDETIKFHEGFVTVKFVMRYLNDVMELEHHDIVGVVGKDNYEEEEEQYDLFEDGAE